MTDVEQFAIMSKDRFHIYLARILKGEPMDIDRHYIYHTAWAARKLAEIMPEKHVDISSSIYFNSLVSAFIPIDFYGYRISDISLDNITQSFVDLNKLPFDDNSIPSLSCMHVVEHIGLGRYGDVIDPDGDLKAIAELKRVVLKDLLFVVPIGQPRVLFNLHRIYSYAQITEYFKDLELIEFTLIPDKGDPVRNATCELTDEQEYGCGCFHFRKEEK